LKAFEPEEGYYLADSGGKDSTVCHALLEMSGCKHDDHYRLTSVDPPELVQFLKRERPNTEIEKPRYAFTAKTHSQVIFHRKQQKCLYQAEY